MSFLVDVDITSAHTEKDARGFTGGAGPTGLDGDQLSALLLNYETHSVDSSEVFAISTRQQANSIVDWKDV